MESKRAFHCQRSLMGIWSGCAYLLTFLLLITNNNKGQEPNLLLQSPPPLDLPYLVASCFLATGIKHILEAIASNRFRRNIIEKRENINCGANGALAISSFMGGACIFSGCISTELSNTKGNYTNFTTTKQEENRVIELSSLWGGATSFLYLISACLFIYHITIPCQRRRSRSSRRVSELVPITRPRS